MIAGTGHGGAQAAIALRQQGFCGSIVMVGRDREPPYERPPLSKEYLARDAVAGSDGQLAPRDAWEPRVASLAARKPVLAYEG